MYPIDFLYRAARLHPQRTAIEAGDTALAFAGLLARVQAYASALQQADPAAGSRVAVCAGNSVDHIVALLSVLAAGKTWVPLNTRNAVPELDRTLAFTAPSIVVGDADLVAKLAVPAGAHVLHTGADMAALIERNRDRQPQRHERSMEDAQAIKFTGGSTGVPKGVQQPCRAWTATVLSHIHAYGLTEADRYLVAAPVTHGTSTYLLPVLAQGGCIVLPAENKPPALLDALRNRGITITFMPPTLLYMLAAHEDGGTKRFPALRHLVYAGAPMPPHKIRMVRECFGNVLETSYGQTEAPQIVTVMRADDFQDEAKWTSVGRPGLLSDMAIMDPEGRLLPPGEVGEVVVRGDLIMSGYWQQPEKTAETIVDGWLHTGDRGLLDERGYLFLKDRLREVVITGGFNVYPVDVESVLDEHPAVHEAAVFGIEDDKWGEAVHAAVQLKPGATLDVQELIAFAKARLGSVKAPKQVHVYEQLPRSVAGKVHKVTLKADINARLASARTSAPTQGDPA